METYLLTATVESGGTNGTSPLANAPVTLYQAIGAILRCRLRAV
jgi:hypothetical protein